ncbi:MAG: TIGR04086 family membrane protein [Firmicutes bacterium]|nr:TIGR04086 family membrane protein [Bacillota bacterium]
MARRIGNTSNELAPQATIATFVWSIVRGIAYSGAVAICGAILVSLVQLIGGWRIEWGSVFQIFSYLSMATGGFMAARSSQRHGWLVGGLVGMLFILAMNWITSGSVVLPDMNPDTVLRLGMGFIVGAAGGMIGVNL